MGRGARNAAIRLSEKTLEPAIQFDLTDVVLEVVKILKWFAASSEGDKKKWEHYNQLFKETESVLNIINRADSMYEELILPFVKSRSSKPWMAEKAKEYLNELEPYALKYDNFRVKLYYFLIARLEREILHDYPGIIEVCQRAINYFDGRPSTQKTTIAMFSHTQVVAHTMLGNYEEAEQIATRALEYVTEGTLNWYKGREQHLVLKFYKRDYQAAWEIFRQARYQREFSLLPAMEQESWKIFEGFVHLLIGPGKIQPVAEKAKAGGFKVQKFLNEIPEFSKDKRGQNIPALILHALFLLQQRQFDLAYDRVLALDKYADRHLSEGDDGFRSWCFIKSLLQIQKADFQRNGAQAKAAEYLQRMGAVPVMLAYQPHEVETIPYEHLWELAMEALPQSGGG